MATAIFPSTISIQVRLNRTQSLSLASPFLPITTTTSATVLSCSTSNRRARDMVVRMGGGPRTFPGGVSKWQWKRMQQKKAKQLLKARLLRERQIYEMRKRTELKSAMAELERPWEAVQKAPDLFSVGADEQVKTLADRFQKPGGFDMWNERDGPQIFSRPSEGLHSVRFFPKGAVHSVKPYTKEGEEDSVQEQGEQLRFDDLITKGAGGIRKTRSWRNKKTIDVECTEGVRQNVSKENYNTDQRRSSSNGGDMIGGESTKGARGNVSKNFSTKWGKAGMNDRNAQGAFQNISKNETRRFKPVRSERDAKVERHGRSNNGNRKFREITGTLRPSSMLSNEEKNY